MLKIRSLNWVLIFVSGMLFNPAIGQYFANPSFEGDPGLSVSPPSWHPFDIYSTPDTEPIKCDNFTASDGSTYLTLITRGSAHPIPNSVENAMTPLLESLEAGKYYKLSIDLASREEVGHFNWEQGFISYSSPVKLKIFGSESVLDKGELLTESMAITNHTWDRYSLILFPQSTISYLLVEAGMAKDVDGMGNLLLDRIHIEELDEPPVDFGALEIPNVFTPNGDGVNDELVIRGLKKSSQLFVFDRLGIEVFKSYDYEHNWDGKDLNGKELPSGTYWIILFPSNMDEAIKGLVYLKRE